MIIAADTPDQNLTQYFPICNDFIHAARLQEKNVLIHCLAGMSRSVTVCVAYIMSVSSLSWQEALKVVRSGRNIANPNHGFQSQLQDFECYRLEEERHRIKERYPSRALVDSDREECYIALNNYEMMLQSKSICEGDCKRGENCPTGLCRIEQKAMLRRKSSQSSTTSLNSTTSRTRSCPASPRHSKYGSISGVSGIVGGCGSSSGSSISGGSIYDPKLPSSVNKYKSEVDELMELRDVKASLHDRSLVRSASTVSSNRYCAPRGLLTYTGSAPSSLRGSRVDLNYTPPPLSSSSVRPSGSVVSVVSKKLNDISGSRGSLTNSPTRNPTGKPPPSPKRSIKRFSAT